MGAEATKMQAQMGDRVVQMRQGAAQMGEVAAQMRDGAAQMTDRAAQILQNHRQGQNSGSSSAAPSSAPENTTPSVRAVSCKPGDKIVCLGTAFGRYEKGQTGIVQRIENPQQALVLLDGQTEPITIGQACFEHADGIEWELEKPRKRGTLLPSSVKRKPELEENIQELFRQQDLNGNGVLEELELIKLNQKISFLHYGKDADKQLEVKENYTKLFREKLDIRGEAVVYPLFREYILQQLDAVDPDERAQIMIVEQWIAEAESGREAFTLCSMNSESDLHFMPKTVY